MRRILLPATLALLSLSAGVAALRADPALPPGAEGAPPGSVAVAALEAPILSPRRAPSLLARPIGTARLVQELQGIVASSPASACLMVTEGRRVLFEQLPDQPLAPASGMKLLTAAAVIHHIDPEERLRTSVVAAQPPVGGVIEGDLWLVGGGDPVLGTAAWAGHFTRQPAMVTPLEALADRIRDAGVSEVRGRVVGDDSRYDASRYVTGWPERYIASNEIGPVSALSVNDGFEAWEPLAVPFPEPAVGAAGVLTGLLRERGVIVAGEPAAGTAAGTVPVASIDSPTVSELVGQMLRESDNGTAEMLVKELGLRVGLGGTTAAGTSVVSETMSELGLPTGGLSVLDGSGLHPGNRVTCRLLHDLLGATGPGGPIDAGLAVAGTDGTLAERFLGTPASGLLRAKTGSIRGVASLSGFARTQGGEELVFSSILNGIDRFDGAVPLHDTLASALVRYPDLPALDEIGPAGYPAAA